MKYVKILGLLAVAAAAIMAFAGNASATTVVDGSGNTTPTIHAVHEGSHVELHNSFANILCNTTVEGTVTSHGTGVPAAVGISSLVFNNCTGGWVVTVVSKGTFSIHYLGAGAGHGEGTLTWNGATVTFANSGINCHYRTVNKDLGKVIGGNRATLKLEAAIERHGGSLLCGGSTVTWTGNIETTSTLKIEP